MKAFYVTVSGYFKRERTHSKAYSAIVFADSEKEAEKKVFQGYVGTYLTQVLSENPKMNLRVSELNTDEIFTIKFGRH